jgi:hypothetical protein
MADDKRFVKVYNQGFFDRTMEVWVDKKTGVNYLATQSGYSGGLCVLVDAQGKPIVTPIRDYGE